MRRSREEVAVAGRSKHKYIASYGRAHSEEVEVEASRAAAQEVSPARFGRQTSLCFRRSTARCIQAASL